MCLSPSGLDDVAKVFGVSSRSIYRWSNLVEATGIPDLPSVNRGRVYLLNSAAIDGLQGLIKDNASRFLDEIVDWLAIHHDILISITALHDNLHDLGPTYKTIKRTAAQHVEEVRALWREDVVTNFSCEQLVFLDESSKDGKTFFRKYGCAMRGEQPTEQVPFERGERRSLHSFSILLKKFNAGNAYIHPSGFILLTLVTRSQIPPLQIPSEVLRKRYPQSWYARSMYGHSTPDNAGTWFNDCIYVQ